MYCVVFLYCSTLFLYCKEKIGKNMKITGGKLRHRQRKSKNNCLPRRRENVPIFVGFTKN
ncbi:MAG TPA: hypothetical protein DCE65_07210 [Clostridiales bacterium]|nr:hypothetical protein [Clostridiales bacterium]